MLPNVRAAPQGSSPLPRQAEPLNFNLSTRIPSSTEDVQIVQATDAPSGGCCTIRKLLLSEALTRNVLWKEGTDECNVILASLVELCETILWQNLNAEVNDALSVCHHAMEAPALSSLNYYAVEQRNFASHTSQIKLTEHKFVLGELFYSYTNLHLTTFEDLEAALTGEIEKQNTSPVPKANNPPPTRAELPSRGDMVEGVDVFWELRPSHHKSIAFKALRTSSHISTPFTAVPSDNWDPIMESGRPANVQTEKPTCCQLMAQKLHAFANSMASQEAEAFATHLLSLITSTIHHNKPIWVVFAMSVAVAVSSSP